MIWTVKGREYQSTYCPYKLKYSDTCLQHDLNHAICNKDYCPIIVIDYEKTISIPDFRPKIDKEVESKLNSLGFYDSIPIRNLGYPKGEIK